MSIRAAIKKWWDGTTRPYENPPNSSLVFIGFTTEWHWSARIARWLVAFWKAEWKWIVGTMMAMIGLAIAYARLP